MTSVEELEVTGRGANVMAVLSVIAGALAFGSMIGLGTVVPEGLPGRLPFGLVSLKDEPVLIIKTSDHLR